MIFFAVAFYPIDDIEEQFHYKVTTDSKNMRNGLNDLADNQKF